jgi:hypothetical protein
MSTYEESLLLLLSANPEKWLLQRSRWQVEKVPKRKCKHNYQLPVLSADRSLTTAENLEHQVNVVSAHFFKRNAPRHLFEMG